MERIKNTSLYIFYGLLAYMPLHILISTWVGTSFGALEFAKVAKDIVLVIGFLMALIASVRTTWFKGQLKDKLLWVILAYAGLTLLLAAVRPTDQDAEVLGVVYNLRFLLFFLYGWLLTGLFPKRNIINQAVIIALVVGVIVCSFGVIQYTILPNDALAHIGYTRENGVLPAFFIDDKPDLERIMSTVRDPNSLGSYLIIIASFGLALLWRYRREPFRLQLFAGVTGLALLSLLLTFSRSAWVGMVFTAVTLVVILRRELWKVLPPKKVVISSLAMLLVISLFGLFVARDSYIVQNVILHADESTVLEDPNELRIKFIGESVADIAEEPLGSGPGTAGLASIRNNEQGTILNENYYLQIATEVGLLGLSLFLAIIIMVGKKVFYLKHNHVVIALFASFVGLAVTNLLVHIWSNEAVAYTWWGLAGLALFSAKRNNRTKLS